MILKPCKALTIINLNNNYMDLTNFITINELAKQFNLNKSTINFWYKQGYIKPLGIIGKALIFDKLEAVKAIKRRLEG